MEIQRDFEELLELLNARKVDYVIVGGYALAFHGAPRFTGDLDLFIKPEHANAELILDALISLGFGSLGLKAEDFTAPGQVVQLGFPPVRIDMLTSLTGVTWEDVRQHAVQGQYGREPVLFIGKEELIRNKKSLARHRDLADIEALGDG